MTLTTNRMDCIPAFDLTKRGRIKEIYGHVVVGGRAYDLECGGLVAEGAAQELRAFYGKKVNVNIDVLPKGKVDSYSDGIGVIVVAETTTKCLFGGSALHGAPKRKGGRGKGRKNRGNDQQQQQQTPDVDYHGIGRSAARELITDWQSTKGGCTDRWLQDQLIIFMALAKGKSRMATCALELHTETAIHIAEVMTGVKFKVSSMKDGTVLIECEGMGYSVSGVDSLDMDNVKKAVESAEQKGNGDENEEDGDDEEDEDGRRNYLFNRPSLF